MNKALEALDVLTVTGVSTPGHMRIAVETEDLKLTLAVRPSAVAVESTSALGAA